jgi:hypothetical protein
VKLKFADFEKDNMIRRALSPREWTSLYEMTKKDVIKGLISGAVPATEVSLSFYLRISFHFKTDFNLLFVDRWSLWMLP